MQLTDRDRKMLYVLGAVAAFGLLYLAIHAFGGGGGGEVALPTGPAVSGPGVTPTPTPAKGHKPPPIDLSGTRDPFEIPAGLAVSPTPSGAVTSGSPATSPTATSPTATSPPATSPQPSPTTSPSPSPSPSPTPSPHPDASIQIGGHTVRLRDIFGHQSRVKVAVDHKLYVVEEGARFDDNFKLVKILGNRCARFVFGDESFDLCRS